jgi:hypothetical protein
MQYISLLYLLHSTCQQHGGRQFPVRGGSVKNIKGVAFLFNSLFCARVLQIPAFTIPGHSIPHSIPRFPVPCFTGSRVLFNKSRN